jgi:hypothetical protein
MGCITKVRATVKKKKRKKVHKWYTLLTIIKTFGQHYPSKSTKLRKTLSEMEMIIFHSKLSPINDINVSPKHLIEAMSPLLKLLKIDNVFSNLLR